MEHISEALKAVSELKLAGERLQDGDYHEAVWHTIEAHKLVDGWDIHSHDFLQLAGLIHTASHPNSTKASQQAADLLGTLIKDVIRASAINIDSREWVVVGA